MRPGGIGPGHAVEGHGTLTLQSGSVPRFHERDDERRAELPEQPKPAELPELPEIEDRPERETQRARAGTRLSRTP
ncbi:hypothetical protein [Nonomuraea jabiensis]|uniref:hypothetical protein n=1 Tax=Nonomuraea jabiensis TaxID=882448 RepID=UPI0036CC8BB1